jgi:AraC-like DNA-binding protein
MSTAQPNPEPELLLWRDGALSGAHLAKARYRAHTFERHVHDELVIAVTEDGAGRCQTRFGSDTSSPGTVWVFAPGEYHRGWVWNDRRWNYRGIYLDQHGLKALAQVFADEDLGRMWLQPGLHHDPQVAKLLLQAHRCMEDEASHLERQTHWWVAMGLLFGRYGQSRPRLESARRERNKMQLVREYLAAHYTQSISVEELATVSGLSRFHLMRAFTREYGMPPHAYTNQLRLTEARRLIAAGRSISDAAASAGFYDQSHLTRMFKRAYGVTPGVYASLDATSSARVRRTRRDGPAESA